MSTNGGTVGPRTVARLGGRKEIEEIKGARNGSSEDTPIQPGEMGYPIGGDPWRIMGLEDPSVMRLSRDVSLEDLEKMTQRDGHARAMLNVLSWPGRAAKRVIEPDEDGEEEADFIRGMLEDPPHRGGMTTTMDYILASHGLAYRDGFKCFEKVTAIRETKEGETGAFREVLRKLVPLPSDTIAFRYDAHGGFAGIVQTIYWQGEKRIVSMPPEKVLVFTVGKETSPLEGESLFLPAYYHYDKKHRLYYIAHIAAQAGATGFAVGKIGSAQSPVKAEFLRQLSNLGLSRAMVAPLEAEVDLLSASSILGDILLLIEHHDVSMSKSILAHFLDVGTEGKGGLGTATTTSELGDLFVVALEAHLKNIAEGVTSYLIPYFVDRNFGSGKYPTFRFEPFSDETKTALADTFGRVFNAASQPVPEMMFEVQRSMADALGLENIDWDEIKARFDAEQQQQGELKALARKAQVEQIKNPPKVERDPRTGKPFPPPPSPVPAVSLAEDYMARAVALAEALASGRQVNDSFGMPIVVGDRVTKPEDDKTDFGPDGAIYKVMEIHGSTLVLVRDVGDDTDDTFVDKTPHACPANEVHLLGGPGY